MKQPPSVAIPLPSLTEEQARALREQYRKKNTADALVTLALAIAGIWALGELVRESEKTKRRRKRA